MNQIQYRTVEIFLDKSAAVAEEKIELPDGVVTHIGLVKDSITTDIINLELLQNTTRILDPCDIRFSERTTTGSFLDGLRPVSGIRGGQSIKVRLSAITVSRPTDLTVQVLFAIKPIIQY